MKQSLPTLFLLPLCHAFTAWKHLTAWEIIARPTYIGNGGSAETAYCRDMTGIQKTNAHIWINTALEYCSKIQNTRQAIFWLSMQLFYHMSTRAYRQFR